MKAYKKALVATAISAALISPAFAEDLKLTRAAKKALRNLSSADYVNVNSGRFIKYNDHSVKAFSKLKNIYTDKNQGYLVVGHKNSSWKNQCYSFVAVMTGQTHRFTPKKGRSVKKSNVKFGTAIAVFDSRGVYKNDHIAIFISKTNNYINVLHQNWNKKNVSVDKIYFRGAKSGIGNAANYYVVEK